MSEPTNRRDFLRGLFRRVSEPTGRALAHFETKPAGPPRRLIRPPGALPEPEFLDRCEGSGRCVDACPVDAIRRWEGIDERLNGTPFIAPNLQACVLCDDLACMGACPSGALRRLPREAIRIGMPRVDYAYCARTRGEDCRLCIERCPIGESAISLDPEGRVIVTADACTGCGVCQYSCPERPKAITVWPV